MQQYDLHRYSKSAHTIHPLDFPTYPIHYDHLLQTILFEVLYCMILLVESFHPVFCYALSS